MGLGFWRNNFFNRKKRREPQKNFLNIITFQKGNQHLKPVNVSRNFADFAVKKSHCPLR